MSTPISGNNVLGLLSVPNSQDPSVSQGQSQSSQVGATPDASLSLSSMQVVASRAEVNVGLLAQEFAQAANGATTVDPSTGMSEVSATARTQLSSTLNTLLVQSGFSQSQADAATKSFADELSQGGAVDLNASFDESTTVASSMSTSYGTGYGSRTMSISTVAVNERSGSVAIDFDPSSGKLSISLAQGQVQTVTSTTEILRPAAAVPSTSGGGLPASGDQAGDSNDAKKQQNSAGSLDGSSGANSLLSELIAGLGQPKLHGSQEALELLKGVTKGAQAGNANATTGAGDATSAATTNTTGTTSPSADAPVSVTIGFTQALSISLLDLNGHGTTLFKRPDGDTAAMSFEPTHIEA
ncbi:hypothetical protein [Paraburkholderia sp. ZP32-5]|uniref:hypothetical protein n=1 Tax=Paraburkholderia sp. ZP32-5 TaxID=2883245 RepID=UPI001F442542|nr:hypothetical protein [Paraburkholderia sp. ZP32-5]